MKEFQFFVKVVNPKAKNIPEAFGISESRCGEICGYVEKVVKDNSIKTVADTISKVSEKCESLSELAFLSYVSGQHFSSGGRMKSIIGMAALMALLK